MTADIADTIYRAMKADDDGGPNLDASARTLGARHSIDIPGDSSDDIEPGTGGMSTSIGDPSRLPTHRRPAAFGGSGLDPVFAINPTEPGEDLAWRADPDGPLGHGFLKPVR